LFAKKHTKPATGNLWFPFAGFAAVSTLPKITDGRTVGDSTYAREPLRLNNG
jgi:hypothetical protein